MHPILYDLVSELESAPAGARGGVVGRYAAKVGRSPATVWRWLREARGPGTSRPRRPRVDDETIHRLEEIRRRCSDGEHARVLPADLVIEKAVAAGVIRPGEISTGQFCRRVKEQGLDRHRPCVRFEASRSNQVHHVDASGSEYFVLEEQGDERVVRIVPPGRSRKNRPRRDRELLWLIGVVDDHSRVMAARYVTAAGETAVDTIHTLAWAWGGEDPRLVLCGLPDEVYADKGPFANSAVGKQFCESLDIQLVPRRPGNPRATGKVERPWRTCWSRFELSYIDDVGRVMSLEELHAELCNYLAREADRDHPRLLKRTRKQVYLADRGEVRTLPADYLRAAWRPETRKVAADGTVQFERTLYRVADELVGETVTVIKRADGALAISGPDGRTWAAEPFVPLEFGTYHIAPAQPGDGVDAAAAALPPGPALYAGDAETATLPLPGQGQEVAVDSPFDRVGRFASVDDAMAYVGQRIGGLARLSDGHRDRVEGLLAAHELSLEYVEGLAAELVAALA